MEVVDREQERLLPRQLPQEPREQIGQRGRLRRGGAEAMSQDGGAIRVKRRCGSGESVRAGTQRPENVDPAAIGGVGQLAYAALVHGETTETSRHTRLAEQPGLAAAAGSFDDDERMVPW